MLVLAALAIPALAGCTSPAPPTSSSSTQPVPTPEPYALDCSIAGPWNVTPGEACLAHASANDSPSKAEIDIAVNPKNPQNVFVASKDLDPLASPIQAATGRACVWAVGDYTLDGGKHWNTTYVGGKLADRKPGDALYGWECITDPIMTFNKNGDLFYTLQVYQYRPVQDPTGQIPQGSLQALAVSHDGGKTFPDIYALHAGDDEAIFHDYMRTAASPKTGTVFSIWNQLSCPRNVGCAESVPVLVAFDGATNTVRPPVYFPNVAGGGGISLGESSLTVATDGTVIAWLGGGNSGGEVWYSTSTDDGRTFGAPVHAFDVTGVGNMDNRTWRYGTSVEVAVDDSSSPHAGCLYAAWGGQESGTVGASDAYVRRSCDGGKTWTDPALVNTKARADGQWMVRPTVDGNGTVHLVYFTRAYDPAHKLIDAEWAYSTDGGGNWTAHRLTDASFDGDLGIHQGGFPFIGDYIGITSAGQHVYMGFPTTVTGRAEIAVAKAEASVPAAPAAPGV